MIRIPEDPYRIYKISIFLTILIMIAAVSFYITAIFPEPFGWDWNVKHKVWIDQYLHGNFTQLSEYPPLFHFLMLPFVYFFSNSIKYLQPVFSILVTSSLLYLTYKLFDFPAMVITGFIFSFSATFIEYSLIFMPQTIDLILFPIAFLLLSKKKYLSTAALSLFLFYNHTFGIIFFSILLIYSYFYRKEYLRYSIVVFILGFPSLFYLDFLVGLIPFTIYKLTDGIAYMPQALYPISHLLLNSVFLWILLPLTIYGCYKLKFHNKNYIFLLIWILSFEPLILLDFERWFAMFLIPLAILEGSMISKMFNLRRLFE
jgi:hypothetical protein